MNAREPWEVCDKAWETDALTAGIEGIWTVTLPAVPDAVGVKAMFEQLTAREVRSTNRTTGIRLGIFFIVDLLT